MRIRLVALLVLGVFSLLGGWTYERIEPAGNWAWVEMEVMPNDVICVCYQEAASGHIFLVRKDSIWHKDDLGEWNDTVGHHLVEGPEGRPAILLASDSITVYAVLTDTGWDLTTVRFPTNHAFLAFDSSGDPALIYDYPMNQGYYFAGLSSAREHDGIWTADTLYTDWDNGFMSHGFVLPTTFALGPGNRFYEDCGHWTGYTQGGMSLGVDTGRTGAWGTVFEAGGTGMNTYGCSVSPGPSSEFAVCYSTGYWGEHARFYCNNDTVETLAAGPGRVRIDSRDVRQIVYRCGVMKYAYRTSIWHRDTLPPEIDAAQAFDFAVDHNDVPLIAFSTADGIFLATGDAVGITEKPPQAVPAPLRLPTIVRGVLTLPRPTPLTPHPLFALLDISGRKVMDLRPGPNDVSHLSPGVYFAACGAKGGTTQKFLITE